MASGIDWMFGEIVSKNAESAKNSGRTIVIPFKKMLARASELPGARIAFCNGGAKKCNAAA
ncbi:MAG: hypothetical protein ACXVC0_00375 [Bdellovibrionota bacterium]